MEIINVIIIGIIALIPILGWAYLFSYLDNATLHGNRFIAGMIAGAASVVPVLYLEKILKFFGVENLNILTLITENSPTYTNILLSIGITVVIISAFMSIVGIIFIDHFSKIRKTYFNNTVILLFFSFIFLLIFMISTKIGIFTGKLEHSLDIGEVRYGTIGLVALYYVIIGLLEESSKHFGYIPSSLSFTDSAKKGVVYGVFIALGFGFIENILYLWSIQSDSGYSGTLFSTLFFRSLFSLFVHILCSAIVLNVFLKGYFSFSSNKISIFSYSKVFLFAILSSIAVHAIYDISLTLGFTMIIFIYFIAGYLYITKIFYKET